MSTNVAAKRKPGKNRRYWGALALLFAALLAILVDYAGYPYGAALPAAPSERGENGLWLHFSWYADPHSESETDALAARLRENRIAYAYAHVRSVQPDGRLRFRYPENARRLVEVLHREAPGVRVLAWARRRRCGTSAAPRPPAIRNAAS